MMASAAREIIGSTMDWKLVRNDLFNAVSHKCPTHRKLFCLQGSEVSWMLLGVS
jgi:hypothetical protein